jgi:uncharacterized Zn-binding protein involved in type VI secretion
MHVCPMVTGVVPHVGGPILPPGVPTVLIDFLPAATVTDMATCVGPPDVIVMGSAGVFINYLPAARLGDQTAHGGVIVMGSPTCIIGEVGSGSPGAGGLTGVVAGLAAAGVVGEFMANTSAFSQPGSGTGDQAPSSSLATYNQQMQAKAAQSAKFFSGAQSNKDTCALMTTDSIKWEKTGSSDPPAPPFGIKSWIETLWADMNISSTTPQNEKEMIAVGISSGGYQFCNGTTNPAAVMTSAGLPSQNVLSPSLEQIASAVEQGKGVLVGYDTRPVWGGRWAVQPNPAGHAVRVTAVQRDDSGNITGFYINDSGDGKAPKLVPADTFQSALDGLHGGVMSETNDSPFSSVSAPKGGSN